jgi:GNAT superfamily N-acetyltransferase
MKLLDNPVWEALSTQQSNFNIGNEVMKYFAGDVAPFIGLQHWDESDLQHLIDSLPSDRSFSVMIAKEVTLPESVEIIFTTPLYQLYCPELIPFTNPVIEIKQLGSGDVPQMLELTALTKPGPFYEKTIEFGKYFGIYSNDQLVAMAGERLKANGYTEISAICTHPNYLGKGYASCLLSHACEHTIREGNIPFLHVRQDNIRAIDVYKKLGFVIRADVYFAIFKKGEAEFMRK